MDSRKMLSTISSKKVIKFQKGQQQGVCRLVLLIPKILLYALILCLSFHEVSLALTSSPVFDFLKPYKFDDLPLPSSIGQSGPKIVQHNSNMPDWKILWDKGREHAWKTEFAKAAETYQSLLAIKDIQEARWELACISAKLGKIKDSLSLFEVLYGENPDRFEYLQGLAVLTLKSGNYNVSGDLYKKIHDSDNNINSLAGMIYSFLALGEKKKALPFLERLLEHGGDNNELRRAIALIALEIKDFELARKHLVILVKMDSADSEILLKTARLHDQLKLPGQAINYWQKLVAIDSDSEESHRRLADFFQANGKLAEAINHLLFLLQKHPEDFRLIERVGKCYLGLKRYGQALTYFEKYIEKFPTDKEAVRYVVNIHAALGHKTETLSSLEHYFAIESRPGKANLEKAAKLYDEKGYYHEAIEIYRRLLEISPDDPEIMVSLANNFFELGNDEGALAVWRKLAEQAPGVVKIYRTVAVLLERLGREQELMDVLEVIHELDPADLQIINTLARKYYANGNLLRSGIMLEKLSLEAKLPQDYFFMRGNVYLNQNKYDLALDNLEKYLEDSPNDDDIRIKCLVMAGRMGNLAGVRRHYNFYVGRFETLDSGTMFLIGNAFYNCGSYDDAKTILMRLIEIDLARQVNFAQEERSEDTLEAVVLVSKIFRKEKLYGEAEQVLRQGVVSFESFYFLPYLFDIALETGRPHEAGQWLDFYRNSQGADAWGVRLMTVQHLAAIGEERAAKRAALILYDDLFDANREENLIGSLRFKESAFALQLADLLQNIGMYDNAKILCDKILVKNSANFEAQVLLERISWHDSGVQAEQIDLAGLEVWQLIDLANLYAKYNLPYELEKTAQELLTKTPGLLVGRLLLTRALGELGNSDEAESVWATLSEDFPASNYIKTMLVKHYFDAGKIEEAMHYCSLILAEDESRADILLIQARILWMTENWQESEKKYEKILHPGVIDILRKSSANMDYEIPAYVEEHKLLELLALVPPKDEGRELAKQIMAIPNFEQLFYKGKHKFNAEAAGLFSLYSWQNRAAEELDVRRSIKKKEYFLAEKLFENILLKYPEEKSLKYDLAGVYSRLGKLGEEAAIYEELLAANYNFTALRDSLDKNRLKQKPKMSVTYGYDRREGHNDNINIKNSWQQISLRYSPKTQHQVDLKLARNNYRSATGDDTIRSNTVYAYYKANILTGLAIGLGGGLESLDNGSANLPVFELEVEGKLGDKLVSKLALERGVITDTTDSLVRELFQHNLIASLSFEPLSRLSLGGNYLAKDYSDNNWTTGYDFWTSYILLAEPKFLKVFYEYDFKESKESATTQTPSNTGFFQDDHPYWAPKNFWSNRFGAYYKHILSSDIMGRETPKYYVAEYSFGHDSDGYGFQTFKGGFFVDISPRFQVEASAELSSSPSYRKKEYVLSASYRW